MDCRISKETLRLVVSGIEEIRQGGIAMINNPKWLTPTRKTALVDLFSRSRGFCVFGHSRCQYPHHHYINFIEDLIKDWQSDDRIQRLTLPKAERIQLHRTSDRRFPIAGQFSGVSKEVFFTEQPCYYLLALGINGLTLKPFAKVRLASSFIVLWVELDRVAYNQISKSKKRKAVRYHKRIKDIDKAVNLAVKHYRGE